MGETFDSVLHLLGIVSYVRADILMIVFEREELRYEEFKKWVLEGL